jgi:hypothetical protein
MDQIVGAFQKYAPGDDSWQADFQWRQWEKVKLRGKEQIMPPDWADNFRRNPPQIAE